MQIENLRNFHIQNARDKHGGYHAISVDCIYYPPFAFKVFSGPSICEAWHKQSSLLFLYPL